MQTENQITGALDDLGDALRRQPSVRDGVMRRVTRHAATNGAPSPSRTSRWGGRRMLAKLVAVAACVLVVVLIWSPWGGGGIGAQQAFAAAIARVEAAGTFACRQVYTSIGEDGQEQVREMRFMFMEPNLERLEYGEGMPMEQVMITDYEKRVRLVVLPEDKTASLQDISSMYAVDDKTGQLKPSELGTHAREAVLRISAQAVKDLGVVNLGGRDVWALRAEGDAEPTKTVYVNPSDGKPVQIELAWPSRKQTLTFTDIHIDTPMDEDLFSLEPPQGYAMHGGDEGPVKPVDDMNGKMLAKMKYVVMECYKFSSKNGGKWPAKLDDLTTAGVDAQKLRTLLAAPESRDGKPVILYRQPKPGETDAIVVYEAPEVRRGNNVVAGFTDGHSEVLTEKRFDELMR